MEEGLSISFVKILNLFETFDGRLHQKDEKQNGISQKIRKTRKGSFLFRKEFN